MSDKPLHVQVAEALGWTNCYDRGDGLYLGSNPIRPEISEEIPRFDKSWCSTGPLIARNFICISGTHDYTTQMWWAETEKYVGRHPGRTDTTEGSDFACTASGFLSDPYIALVAVCRLIVKLHSEGKLKA